MLSPDVFTMPPCARASQHGSIDGLRTRVQLRGSAADHGPQTTPLQSGVRMTGKSMRAIWDAVSLAILGAPDNLPVAGHGDAELEQKLSPVSPSQVLSPFESVQNDQRLAKSAPPAIQPPAMTAVEVSEPAPAEMIMGDQEALPPPVLFSEEGDGAVQDFFLFIQDYSWSLRYRVRQLTGSILDLENPLQLEWVKLRRPIHNPTELLNTSGEELFDWAKKEPPNHHGFMYQVTRAVGSGVEAVINFFEGYGLKLLIQPDSGIQLFGRPESSKEGAERPQRNARPVTHCWVQVMGMPFLPILQSISFFNLEETVMDWQA